MDKALEDKADQYVRDFKAAMKEKRIGFKKVNRVPGTWDIRFELKDAKDRTRLEKRILDGYYNLEQVGHEGDDESIVRVTFDDEYVEELRKNARDQARVTVRNRVDEFGVAEPTIAPHGENGILVQLPGMFDPERAKGLLGRTAQLEFKMVDDESDFIRNLKGKLPEGIRMEYYTYEGPNEEPVTEAFLIAKGEGNEARNRLLDFFNNAKEIEQFLKDRKVDAKLTEAIMKKVRGGLTPIERRDILEMAAPALIAEAPSQPAPAIPAEPNPPADAKPAQVQCLSCRRTADSLVIPLCKERVGLLSG